MLLSCDETGARVSLVPEGALLLAGDAVRIEIEVGPGAGLVLVEPAGTVAYDMRSDPGGAACWDVDVTLGAGARLVWHGEPFVAAAGSQTTRRVRVELGRDARLALRETLVLGRQGEPAGRLTQEFLLEDADGEPVLAEGLDVGPTSGPVLLGGHRVVSSILVAGVEFVGGIPGTRLDLEGGASVVRQLADATHLALDDTSWRAAVAAVTAP